LIPDPEIKAFLSFIHVCKYFRMKNDMKSRFCLYLYERGAEADGIIVTSMDMR
jgi:hypothetical protein